MAKAPTSQDQAALSHLVTEVKGMDGVAQVDAAPMKPGQSVGTVRVVPTTSPRSVQTSDLITHLRDRVIPQAEHGSDLQVYVGGSTASSDDFANVLTSELPVFLAIIIGLGGLLMMIAFRSLLVSLIGVAMKLLAMGGLQCDRRGLPVGLGVRHTRRGRRGASRRHRARDDHRDGLPRPRHHRTTAQHLVAVIVALAGIQALEHAEGHGLGRIERAQRQTAADIGLVLLDDRLDQAARGLVHVGVPEARAVAGAQMVDIQSTQGLLGLGRRPLLKGLSHTGITARNLDVRLPWEHARERGPIHDRPGSCLAPRP
ncbi:MMPL family transporter [Streptomyces asiaticus]|uniref:MMPL family transporter n=2 Tax=Streptomyces asiaticus TaxID=114695 RepID=UPI001BA65B95|nr:MMPL family transporter [Streptomyces asiaticus]